MTDRRTLPPRRHVETFEVRHGPKGAAFQVSVGYYETAAPFLSPAEVFISGSKAGSEHEGVARDGAVLLSIALQYGVPIDVIRGAMTSNEDGSPMTIVGAVVERLAGPRPDVSELRPPPARHAVLTNAVREAVKEVLK
jgi:hypothetical protein